MGGFDGGTLPESDRARNRYVTLTVSVRMQVEAEVAAASRQIADKECGVKGES